MDFNNFVLKHPYIYAFSTLDGKHEDDPNKRIGGLMLKIPTHTLKWEDGGNVSFFHGTIAKDITFDCVIARDTYGQDWAFSKPELQKNLTSDVLWRLRVELEERIEKHKAEMLTHDVVYVELPCAAVPERTIAPCNPADLEFDLDNLWFRANISIDENPDHDIRPTYQFDSEGITWSYSREELEEYYDKYEE